MDLHLFGLADLNQDLNPGHDTKPHSTKAGLYPHTNEDYADPQL